MAPLWFFSIFWLPPPFSSLCLDFFPYGHLGTLHLLHSLEDGLSLYAGVSFLPQKEVAPLCMATFLRVALNRDASVHPTTPTPDPTPQGGGVKMRERDA